ncbi:MAG: riboflavin synthase [Phycisphaerales bacterium JB065]
MFTGLVQAVGTVKQVEPRDFGARFVVDPGDWDYQPAPGDSVAINGCCLTIIEPDRADSGGESSLFRFDVITETLRKTTLGDLKPGHRVNLEHAARADTLLGGHIVQGHIDGLGRVSKIQDDPSNWRIRIEAPDAVMECVAPKGSITVEGVSLTVAEVETPKSGRPRWFEVALIPTTLDLTNLRDRRAGDTVNLETDILARQAVHWLRHYAALGQP